MSLRWILHVLVVGTLSVHVSAAQAGQEPTADFYVSPAGNDAWSGTLAEPKPDGRDGPLATPLQPTTGSSTLQLNWMSAQPQAQSGPSMMKLASLVDLTR